jgi:anthranilate phosphoribosyltransferase
VAANKKIALNILEARLGGALKDWVLLNAAAGLWISGISKSIREGMRLAEHSMDSGKALRALEGLIRISHSVPGTTVPGSAFSIEPGTVVPGTEVC